MLINTAVKTNKQTNKKLIRAIIIIPFYSVIVSLPMWMCMEKYEGLICDRGTLPVLFLVQWRLVLGL